MTTPVPLVLRRQLSAFAMALACAGAAWAQEEARAPFEASNGLLAHARLFAPPPCAPANDIGSRRSNDSERICDLRMSFGAQTRGLYVVAPTRGRRPGAALMRIQLSNDARSTRPLPGYAGPRGALGAAGDDVAEAWNAAVDAPDPNAPPASFMPPDPRAATPPAFEAEGWKALTRAPNGGGVYVRETHMVVGIVGGEREVAIANDETHLTPITLPRGADLEHAPCAGEGGAYWVFALAAGRIERRSVVGLIAVERRTGAQFTYLGAVPDCVDGAMSLTRVMRGGGEAIFVDNLLAGQSAGRIAAAAAGRFLVPLGLRHDRLFAIEFAPRADDAAPVLRIADAAHAGDLSCLPLGTGPAPQSSALSPDGALLALRFDGDGPIYVLDLGAIETDRAARCR